MSEHDRNDEERVDDLDVPESESEDVKGGMSLNFSKIEYQSNAQKFGKVDIEAKKGPGGARFADGSV